MNIIDEISVSRDLSELNDAFYNISTKGKLFSNFQLGFKYTYRFLGPFVKAYRVYTGLLKYTIPWETLKSILEGDHNLGYEILKKIDANCAYENPIAPKRSSNEQMFYYSDSITGGQLVGEGWTPRYPERETSSKSLNKSKNLLRKIIEGPSKWQKCVLVNALNIDENELIILTLTKQMCKSLRSLPKSPYPVSGIYAHNIVIEKENEKANNNRDIYPSSNYKVSLTKSNFLSQEQINNIVNFGLYNIEKIIEKHDVFPYYYKMRDNVQIMPENFIHSLKKQFQKYESSKHFNATEKQLGSIPSSAFERKKQMGKAIESLEL